MFSRGRRRPSPMPIPLKAEPEGPGRSGCSSPGTSRGLHGVGDRSATGHSPGSDGIKTLGAMLRGSDFRRTPRPSTATDRLSRRTGNCIGRPWRRRRNGWLRNAKRKPNELWKPATRGNRGAGPRGRETAEASQPPSASPSVTPPLVLAPPLSLTGRYAVQGRLAARAGQRGRGHPEPRQARGVPASSTPDARSSRRLLRAARLFSRAAAFLSLASRRCRFPKLSGTQASYEKPRESYAPFLPLCTGPASPPAARPGVSTIPSTSASSSIWIERQTSDLKVAGSSPSWRTEKVHVSQHDPMPHNAAGEGGNRRGNWHRKVVQLREWLRFHLPGERPRCVRAPKCNPGRGVQEPRVLRFCPRR
jgi:hypothetical protein